MKFKNDCWQSECEIWFLLEWENHQYMSIYDDAAQSPFYYVIYKNIAPFFPHSNICITYNPIFNQSYIF